MNQVLLPPTSKQEKWARQISEVLGKPLPDVRTKQSYWTFISIYGEQARKEIARQQAERRAAYRKVMRSLEHQSRVKHRYTQDAGEYCGPHGSDIVDCFDYGIAPWGDS